MNDKLPFVSICTPTNNRRHYMKMLVHCFLNQNYPMDKLEWIICDDGIDDIWDIVENIKQVVYLRYNHKLSLGFKRNIMNQKCKGDIIVYMDDDDYYHPTRVSHAVETLINSTRLVAGCVRWPIFFTSILEIFVIDSPSRNHITANTLAFKKEYLEFQSFNNQDTYKEESHFLSNFSIPVAPLDATLTIVQIAHSSNTVDKHFILDPGYCRYRVQSSYILEQIIADEYYIAELKRLTLTE